MGSKITADSDCSHEIKRCLLFGRKVMTNPDSMLKSKDITLPTKVHVVKTMVFPVVMYGCKSWTIKKGAWQRINALNCGAGEDSWESLGQQGDKPVNPKGNQPWILTGRTDAEVETLILWPSDVKSWLIGKNPKAEKDWRQKVMWVAKDEVVR